MTELSAYKTILDAATNPASEPKPKEVHVSNPFAAFLFGEGVVASGFPLAYKGIPVSVFSMPVTMHLMYGDYDPDNYK